MFIEFKLNIFESNNKFEKSKKLLTELATALSEHLNFSIFVEDIPTMLYISLPDACYLRVKKPSGDFILPLPEDFEKIRLEIYATENHSLIKQCQNLIPGFREKKPSQKDITERKHLRELEKGALNKLSLLSIPDRALTEFDGENIEVPTGANRGVITTLEQCRYLWSVGMGPCVTLSISQGERALMVHVNTFDDPYGNGKKSAKPFLDLNLLDPLKFDLNRPYSVAMVGGSPEFWPYGRENILDIYQYLVSRGFDNGKGVFKTSIGDNAASMVVLDLQTNIVYPASSDDEYHYLIGKRPKNSF